MWKICKKKYIFLNIQNIAKKSSKKEKKSAGGSIVRGQVCVQSKQ